MLGNKSYTDSSCQTLSYVGFFESFLVTTEVRDDRLKVAADFGQFGESSSVLLETFIGRFSEILKFGMPIDILERDLLLKLQGLLRNPGGATRGQRMLFFIHFFMSKRRFLKAARQKLRFCTPASFWAE